MPLGFYLETPQGRRKSVTLPTNFGLDDFRHLIEKKVGNPEHYDYSLGDVIFRTWDEESFNRQRSAIHDDITLIIQYPPVGSNSPPWRQASSGLCLEGVCLNAQCQAFEHKVIKNQGIGKFNIINNSIIITSECPLCNISIQPTVCAFYQCSWKVSGVKLDETNKMLSSTKAIDWQTTTNDYYRWEDNLTSWTQLTIETRIM
ncbi:unnamed protein product [Adineta steineri]|uniref:Uncharacterized protein n=1 Tax=Adineta steineri TaxID=433720 RepID=A0A819Z9N2_9BILA|nr:unnamed protein product [Adineta steineri]CAF4160392.1 unnamed protein product [Adineta steineri]